MSLPEVRKKNTYILGGGNLLQLYRKNSGYYILRYGDKASMFLPLTSQSVENFGTLVSNLENREFGSANVKNAMNFTMQNIWIPNKNNNRHQMTILILNHALDSLESFCEALASYVTEEIIFIIIAIGEAYADSNSHHQCFHDLSIPFW